MTHHVFESSQGRRLGITGHGEPLGTRVVILCPTAPGSGEFDPDPVASVASQLRIIAIDRPGYGASDRYVGEPRLARWTDDVGEYVDRIEPLSEHSTGVDVRVVGAVGIGYGCFFAAALAAAHPEAIPHLVLVAPPAPLRRSDPQWDPALSVDGRIDPMSGLLDRRQLAIDAAESHGAAADHLLLADAGWGHRIHGVRASADLYTGDSPDDAAAARWWNRHLQDGVVHHGFGTGVRMVSAVWASALDEFGAALPTEAAP
jgi:pimeloyl-ACP methyl ester carboxylesterase